MPHNHRNNRLAWVHDVKPSYFLAAFVVFTVISIVTLRHNYVHMTELRQAVYTADENNGDVEQALQNLRSYVTTHMNTSLTAGSQGVYPPIQLKYTYQRLVQGAGQQASSTNSQVYSEAQKYCEQQIPNGFSGRYRLDCIEKYVQQHAGGSVTNIPDSLYKFDFASPYWSPDLAGWSIVGAFLSLVIGVTLLVVRKLHEHRG